MDGFIGPTDVDFTFLHDCWVDLLEEAKVIENMPSMVVLDLPAFGRKMERETRLDFGQICSFLSKECPNYLKSKDFEELGASVERKNSERLEVSKTTKVWAIVRILLQMYAGIALHC